MTHVSDPTKSPDDAVAFTKKSQTRCIALERITLNRTGWAANGIDADCDPPNRTHTCVRSLETAIPVPLGASHLFLRREVPLVGTLIHIEFSYLEIARGVDLR